MDLTMSTVLTGSHPEMSISGFELSAFSVQLSEKTKKKQIIKLIADG